MLLFGRLSDKIVWPDVYAAVKVPVLVTAIVHVQLSPSVVTPPTLVDLTAVRSGAVTVTLLLHVLLPSLLSGTLLLGSTVQLPPPRGLANVPIALGVASSCTSNAPPGASVTAPLAVQIRSWVPLMLQATVPLFGADKLMLVVVRL